MIVYHVKKLFVIEKNIEQIFHVSLSTIILKSRFHFGEVNLTIFCEARAL